MTFWHLGSLVPREVKEVRSYAYFYMSPKMPANVLRRFFIVSSESSRSRATAATVPGETGPDGREPEPPFPALQAIIKRSVLGLRVGQSDLIYAVLKIS